MTYCVAMSLDAGMIFASDSRTNALASRLDSGFPGRPIRLYELDERPVHGRQVEGLHVILVHRADPHAEHAAGDLALGQHGAGDYLPVHRRGQLGQGRRPGLRGEIGRRLDGGRDQQHSRDEHQRGVHAIPRACLSGAGHVRPPFVLPSVLVGMAIGAGLAAVDQGKVQLGYTIITSPINGRTGHTTEAHFSVE